MSDSNQNDEDESRRLAEALGLNNLSDSQLKQLLKAARVAATRRSLLNTDTLLPSDEPAHVFALP